MVLGLVLRMVLESRITSLHPRVMTSLKSELSIMMNNYWEFAN